MIKQSRNNHGLVRNVCVTGAFLFLVCIAALPPRSTNNKPDENTWSGTVTYTATRRTHHAAPYSDFIYKKWDHFYEQHMEAKLVHNKGVATFNIALLDTNYNREKTGSRIVEQWETEKGSAAGMANTEVSINIDPANKTYSIEVPIPAATGTKIKTFICKGCDQPAAAPITSSLGEDETSIMIENEKSGANPNVLSGEKTERKETDNGESEEIIITRWKLTRS